MERPVSPLRNLIAQALAQRPIRIQSDHVAQVAVYILVVFGPCLLACTAPGSDPVYMFDDPLCGSLGFDIFC